MLEAPDSFAGALPVTDLAALGYTAKAGRRTEDRVTFFDTHDGAFLKLGVTILYSAGSGRWRVLEGDEVKAEQDTLERVPPRDGAPTGNPPSIPYLDALLDETVYVIGGLRCAPAPRPQPEMEVPRAREESSIAALHRLVVAARRPGARTFPRSCSHASAAGLRRSRWPSGRSRCWLLPGPGACRPSSGCTLMTRSDGRAAGSCRARHGRCGRTSGAPSTTWMPSSSTT